jgi:hypothetical protein
MKSIRSLKTKRSKMLLLYLLVYLNKTITKVFKASNPLGVSEWGLWTNFVRVTHK